VVGHGAACVGAQLPAREPGQVRRDLLASHDERFLC
jgi:hypothetical protein